MASLITKVEPKPAHVGLFGFTEALGLGVASHLRNLCEIVVAIPTASRGFLAHYLFVPDAVGGRFEEHKR